MDEQRHTSVPAHDGPSAEERRRYQADLAAFRNRKRTALVVAVVANVLAVVLLALGGALALGSLNRISGEYLAQRHAPGQDRSVTLPRDGGYAITSSERPLPECTVEDLDGTMLSVTRTTMPGDDSTEIAVFDAKKGSYRITCEGGNAGIVAFAMDEIDVVTSGWRGLLLNALPFLLAGIGAFLAGRYLPRRIAPESMRPLIPS